MDPVAFVDHLRQISFKNVFNPYRDFCSQHDHAESPGIRRRNLERYLAAALSQGVDAVWLGRDCGYRGGRRTGIALTDELQLQNLENHFSFSGLCKATVGPPVKERTATQVWKIIREVNADVFLWNIFPFHPHEAGKPMGNRRHTLREFSECEDVLVALVRLLNPERIVALGADAHSAMLRLGLRGYRVRHPSYGGHVEFAATIRELYS